MFRIIFNLPSRVNDDEIKNYIITLLTTLNPIMRETNPIHSFQKMEEGLYYIFEFAMKDDIDILINLDQTDWRGYRIRVNIEIIVYRYRSPNGSSRIIMIQRVEMCGKEKIRKQQITC